MEENIDSSISNLFDTVKELLPENSDTLNQIEPATSLEENNDLLLAEQLQPSAENIENTINNIEQISGNLNSINTLSNEQSITRENNIKQSEPPLIQTTLDNIKDEVGKDQEKKVIEKIESNQEIQDVLDNIVEDKETELIQQIESDQEVEKALDNIKKEKDIRPPATNLRPEDKRNIDEELYREMEQEVLDEYKEKQNSSNENTETQQPPLKILPQEEKNKEDIFQASFNITPKTEQVYKTVVEPKSEVNNILNNIQPATPSFEDNIFTTQTNTNEINEPLINEVSPKNDLSLEKNNLFEQNFAAFARNEPQTYFSTPELESAEPTIFNRFLEPQIETLDEEKLTNLFKNIQPQEEQVTYEPSSELPQNEMFAEVETAKDENSEQILFNTEKTNTTLESLTQLLATLIQSGGMQAQGTNQAIPVPMPTGSNNTQPGIPDAVLASGQGMIPGIRGKFSYSV